MVFVFPGQGAQWLGMGRELIEQNLVFHTALMECEKALGRWTDFSVLEQLSLSEKSPKYRLDEIGVIQPTLFAIEIALAQVWKSWGIEPSAVVGHSMGEVAAAYIAGALSLEDAARVICMRSQLMQRTSGTGAMAVIGLRIADAERALNGYEDSLSIAVHNSPRSAVVSGDPVALDALMENLRSQDIFCRLIKVDVASHSSQMDPLRPELVRALEGILPQSAIIPFYSTVMQQICDGEALDAKYWGRNLRQPVRFSETIQKLIEDEHVVFIELSPHPTLLSSIEEISKEIKKSVHGFSSLRREQPELATLFGELGALYASGYDIDWNKIYPNGGKVVSLPTYPWQRERYWLETAVTASKQARPGARPLLGEYLQSATGTYIWETSASTKLFPYLKDHRVRGSAVFPAAAYVEMALAATWEIYSSKPYFIKNISFKEAFFIPSEHPQTIQLVIAPDGPDIAEFHFYTRSAQKDSPNSWTLNASGKIEIGQEIIYRKIPSLSDILAHKRGEETPTEFYRTALDHELEYGINFQSIRNLHQSLDGILAKIELSEELVSHSTKYRLHPVLLDACFQTLLAALPVSNQDTYLPTSLENLQTLGKPDCNGTLWCYALPRSDNAGITGDIILFNEDGSTVMTAQGLCLQKLASKQENTRDFLYEVKWHEVQFHIRNIQKLTTG